MLDLGAYNVGMFIKNERTRRNVTQEKLCNGLCDISTLSRIERGLTAHSGFLASALLERLGYYSKREGLVLIGDSNSWLKQRKHAISIAVLHREVETAEKLIAEIENQKELSSGMGLQFVLKNKVVLKMIKAEASGEKIFDECLNDLLRAISITIPAFDVGEIDSYMLTQEEISCINALTGCYFNMKKDYSAALQIQLGLKENLNRFCVNKYEMSRDYSFLQYNIALILCKLRRYDESISAFVECRDFCIEYADFSVMPMLMYVYGECLVNMGKRQQAKAALLNAYHTALTFNRGESGAKSNAVAEYFCETFNIEIEKAVMNEETASETSQQDGIKYLTALEIAEKWSVSKRQVQRLIAADRIPGVRKFGRAWQIPETAEKPNDLRKF